MELPETFHFLNLGWWLVHVVAVALVFYIGLSVGKKKAGSARAGRAGGPARTD